MRHGSAFLLLSLSATVANAEIVSFDFTAEVGSASSEFTSIVEDGSTGEGRFLYDTSASDEDPSPNVGSYPGATLEFTLGSYAYAGPASVVIANNDFGSDGFLIEAAPEAGDPIGGNPLNRVAIVLAGDVTIYTSDALPPAPPPLSHPDLATTVLALAVTLPAPGVAFQPAQILSLPEPGGSGPAIAAGAALGLLSRSRTRRWPRPA